MAVGVDKEMSVEKCTENTSVEYRVQQLLGGSARYTLAEAAQRSGLDIASVRRFWLAMGFPFISHDSDRIFTDYDVHVLKAHASMMDRGMTDPDTLNSLVRAQSHFADRMVLWQYEALVDEYKGRYGVDELTARHAVLDNIGQYEDFFISQMEYAWRRHMAAFMRRAQAELDAAEKRDTPADGAVPMPRAFGFADLVSFTHTSGQLSPHALVDFVQTFEFICRDVISSCGARVVKMVGDAVLYIADDLRTGVQAVNHIVKALKDTPNMPDVRASLVWGSVVSRFGDIFGADVNLASRLCNVAPVNGILVDHGTAQSLYRLDPDGFKIEPYDIPELEGIGTINAARITVLDHAQMPSRA